MKNNNDLSKVIKHFVGNVKNLTEDFSGEHLESVLYKTYESFLYKYFGITKNTSSAEFTVVSCTITKCGRPGELSSNQAAKTMINKLLDANFMTEFISQLLEYRKNVDINCVERGINKYKKEFNIN